MIIQIAVGILLAVFILGLIQELPDAFWYWLWGAVVVFLLYWFVSPEFWVKALDRIVVFVILVAILAPFIYLEHKENKKRQNSK